MYGLRSGLGRCGLGDLVARPIWVDPGYPADASIVAQNTANNDAYQVAVSGTQATNSLDQCQQNAQNANSQAQYDSVMASCNAAYTDAGAYAAQTAVTPVTWYSGGGTAAPFIGDNVTPVKAAGTASTPKGGGLTFATSRGGSALQVGDTWQVSITGATPNAPVTVSGSMPSGSYSGTAMGSTDGSGNFSKAGTLDSSTIGSWQESWAVGGVPSGSISFSVAAAPAPVVTYQTTGTPASSGSGTTPGSTATPGTSVTLPTVGGFDLSTIPWWGWAAAAGVALVAFGKGGR